MISKPLPALALSLIAGLSTLSANSDYIEISSLQELREVAVKSDQKIRMEPGHYVIQGFEPDKETVLLFSGSNNTFDLTGVKIEFPTELFEDMARVPVHGLRMYTVMGDKVTFKGGRFEDSGDTAPQVSVAGFFIEGDDVTFTDCTFIVRGSSPYGVGDMLGKGRGAAVKLRKHSAMAITGDRPYIENCKFRIRTFGHGIHIHGSQDAHLNGVIMMGDQRNTSDIYESEDPLMKQFDYEIQYPSWNKGKPVPRDQWIGLTEDGIRAYLEGKHKSGETRRTGHITVENCAINGMRGGITLALAGSATVTKSLAINCSHGYSLPANSTIKNCIGNATNGPLLTLPYSHKGNSEIELELLPSEIVIGDHPLAQITGSGHKITITARSDAAPAKLRPILIGSTGDRYTEESADSSELQKRNHASNIDLTNLTKHPVELGPYSASCQINTQGDVLKNEGKGNKIRKL